MENNLKSTETIYHRDGVVARLQLLPQTRFAALALWGLRYVLQCAVAVDLSSERFLGLLTTLGI